MKTFGIIIMIGSCILAWRVNGGYTCAAILLIGFALVMIGDSRASNKR